MSLSGWELDNPVIPASGTFGYGQEFSELYDINCLGSFSFKGTTLHPRFGNPTPRIAECPAGLINSVGLQNPGVDHVLAVELPRLARDGTPISATAVRKLLCAGRWQELRGLVPEATFAYFADAENRSRFLRRAEGGSQKRE